MDLQVINLLAKTTQLTINTLNNLITANIMESNKCQMQNYQRVGKTPLFSYNCNIKMPELAGVNYFTIKSTTGT
jgi:hypothetical protein